MRTSSWIRLTILAVAVALAARAGNVSGQDKPADAGRLAVVWSSGDPDVAKRMCFMYTRAAKKQKWFDEVTLIVWGPSARLLAADRDLQAELKAMQDDGVRVQACLACADAYGVTEPLRKLGVDVRYMGKPLTDMLKQGWKVLTF
jgi:hypothetical protein